MKSYIIVSLSLIVLCTCNPESKKREARKNFPGDRIGNLAISPTNQIEILIGIYEETLPFKKSPS